MFRDRYEAGMKLADRLHTYAGRDDVVVLALPRGGVPVAFQVAVTLDAPLDLLLVRKLGLPDQQELAMGAIATGGVRVLNTELIDDLGVSDAIVERVAEFEHAELERRERTYRGDRPVCDVTGRSVIVVDDGLATGSTMRAAITALRMRGPACVLSAVPVAAHSTCHAMREEGFSITTLIEPESFTAVGAWYEDFSATRDEEIRAMLRVAWGNEPNSPPD